MQALTPKQLEPETALCMKPVAERQQESTKPKKKRKAAMAGQDGRWEGQVVPDVDAVIEEIAHLGAGLVDSIMPIER